MAVSSAFQAILTETVSTKRATFTGGLESTPATHISEMDCTPLAPLDPLIRHQMSFNTPHEVLQVFTDGDHDIREGDFLVVDSVDYKVLGVGDWEFGDICFKQIYLEDAKR